MAKVLTFVFITVALCSENIAQDPFRILTAYESQIKSTARDLLNYVNNVIAIELMTSNFHTWKHNEIDDVNSRILEYRRKIRTGVDEAKKKGMDTEHCYVSAVAHINEAYRSVKSVLNKCFDDALTPINAVKDDITVHVAKKDAFLSQLGQIARQCVQHMHSGGMQILADTLQGLSCVNNYVPRIQSFVEAYTETARRLKSNGDSACRKAPGAARRCFERPKSAFHSVLQAIKIAANRCINDIAESHNEL